MMDRLSNLPTHLLQQVLFRLTLKEEIRTRVLAKSWNDMQITSPLTEFNMNFDKFCSTLLDDDTREVRFLEFARDCFARLSATRFSVPVFKLSRRLNLEAASFLDEWITLISRHHLAQFCIDIDPQIRGHVEQPIYMFPQISVASVTPLLTLALARCVLQRYSLCDFGRYSALHLQHLLLYDVRIYNEDEAFQKFVSRCRSLVHIVLSNCSGIKILNIFNNHQLRMLDVSMPHRRDDTIERIEVQSQHLTSLTCEGFLDRPLIVEAIQCRNLTRLIICKAEVEAYLIRLLPSTFPGLKELSLVLCTGLHSISALRHESLKKLQLVYTELDPPYMIDMPNLLDFCYGGSTLPDCRFSIDLDCLKRLELQLQPQGMLSTYWFRNLKTCLKRFETNENMKLKLLLDQTTCTFDVEEVAQISTIAVKELDLHFTAAHFDSYLSLFDGLFWIFRPKIMSITSANSMKTDTFHNVNEMCNCPFEDCWHHSLKEVAETETLLTHGHQSLKFVMIWI